MLPSQNSFLNLLDVRHVPYVETNHGAVDDLECGLYDSIGSDPIATLVSRVVQLDNCDNAQVGVTNYEIHVLSADLVESVSASGLLK